MIPPVAYVLQRRGAEGVLTRRLADAGAEVYAFGSAVDLLLAAHDAVPDLLVADDPLFDRADLGCAVVRAGCDDDDGSSAALVALRRLLRATFEPGPPPVGA